MGLFLTYMKKTMIMIQLLLQYRSFFVRLKDKSSFWGESQFIAFKMFVHFLTNKDSTL